MGGKEAAGIIRQHNQHVPIIFLTGEIAASMKATAKQFEPSHLLLKPCSKKDLIAVSQLRTELIHYMRYSGLLKHVVCAVAVAAAVAVIARCSMTVAPAIATT
jgi:CheY-like chemotaxis protein